MTKRNHSVGYFSAYYRGLECLLQMWPSIRREVPDATLTIAYGWESWLALEGKDALYYRISGMIERLKDDGVSEVGRLSHDDLAELMKRTKVWAYPTEFPEIHCITALKAQAAGCYPVVTTVGALKEVVETGDKIESANIYSNQYAQSKFSKAVVKALKNDEPIGAIDRDYWYWPQVAQQWLEVVNV